MLRAGRGGPRRHAQLLLSEFHIKAPPVPVEKIVRSLGAHLEVVPLERELSGILFFKNGLAVIGANALHEETRRRFAIAHQLGHCLLHQDELEKVVHVDKNYPVYRARRYGLEGAELMEAQASTFAAELLMPEDMLEGERSATVDMDDQGRVMVLAKRFKVSPSTMRHRLIGGQY